MASTFEQILAEESLFKNRDALSPHYQPDFLLHRDREVDFIMRAVSPALQSTKPHNLFVYGKTGTGKTSCAKHVMKKFNEMNLPAQMAYLNCRNYNSRYRVIFKLVSMISPEDAKTGYGISFLYEKLIDWVEVNRINLIVILDEVDMVKDLDDLVYTLTRSNDDIESGSVSLLGISNKISFKEKLGPRSKSALHESELVFSPYNAGQLHSILKKRAGEAFIGDVVDDAALNLAAAIASQETGDARYAFKLLQRAGDLASHAKSQRITEEHVESARKGVDEDVAVEAISTLPEQQQLVLYSVAALSLSGSRYAKLGNGSNDCFLMSGEVYDYYSSAAKKFLRRPVSARWYRAYLSDLEMLGLITLVDSGKGIRGHTRLIKLAYEAPKVMQVVEKLISSGSESNEKENQ